MPGENSTPVPDLLTPEEAAKYLRLAEAGVTDHKQWLGKQRRDGKLKGTLISGRVFYRWVHLDEFMEVQAR